MRNYPTRIFYAVAVVFAVAVAALILRAYDSSVKVTVGDSLVTTPAPPETSTTTTTTADLSAAYEFASKWQEAEAWAFVDAWYRAEVATFLSAWQAAETEAANKAAVVQRPAVSTAVTKPAKPGSVAKPSGGFMACVKNRESRGNYRAVNPSSGAGGAWQFLPGTWANTARHAGRSDLIGVAPQNASPADQDAMAAHLYAWQGASPWAGPGC